MRMPKEKICILEDKEIRALNYYISFLQKRINNLEAEYKSTKCFINVKSFCDHLKIDEENTKNLIETFNLLTEF